MSAGQSVQRCVHGMILAYCDSCAEDLRVQKNLKEVARVRSGRPVPVSVSNDELEELILLQVKPRSDWPAVFSVNYRREIWPFNGRAWTKPEDRHFVYHPLLYEIADIYLRIRNRDIRSGGRFFISPKGVYFREDLDPIAQFITFRIVKHRPRSAPIRQFRRGEPESEDHLLDKILGPDACGRTSSEASRSKKGHLQTK